MWMALVITYQAICAVAEKDFQAYFLIAQVCWNGYYLELITHFIQDIDECWHNNICSTNGYCTDTEGSFNCACNVGYSGDGYDCVGMFLTFKLLVNLIIKPNLRFEWVWSNGVPCSINQTCINVEGNFSCPCRKGFYSNGPDCFDTLFILFSSFLNCL